MNFRHAILCSTFAISTLALAAYADAAKADENPYTPEPATSTETADHGQGAYCSFGAGIPGYSCAAPDLTGGETKGFASREGRHHVAPSAPTSPPTCDHGDDGGGDPGTGTGDGGAAKSKI